MNPIHAARRARRRRADAPALQVLPALAEFMAPVFDESFDSDSFCTPPLVVDRLLRMWPDGVELDPCTNPWSLVPARWRFGISDDGLAAPWETARTVFVNPPYSDPGPWLAMCGAHWRDEPSAELVALVKADTSTAWWRDNVWSGVASTVLFMHGRLRFCGPEAQLLPAAMFPTALVFWGDDDRRFVDAFGELGELVDLFPTCASRRQQ